MDSKEIKEHVLSINTENTKESNKTLIEQAKSICNSVSNFLDIHSSAEKIAMLLLSVAAVFLDPLFFYIPIVKNNDKITCLGLDNNLRIIVVVFRSFVDVLHTILWSHHNLPLVDGRYRRIVAVTVAILAILPLPQVVILAVSWQLLTVRMLKFIVFFQIVIRLCRIILDYKDATRIPDMQLSYPWLYTWYAAAFNLAMYIFASNVLGGFWYLRAVERNIDCWRNACHKNGTVCDDSSLYCGYTSSYKEYLHKHCSKSQALDMEPFDYGIYDEAFQTIITEKGTQFLDKFFRCFWWGLRNLSSLGQNLEPGTYIWDSFFAISIAICGLVLFAFLIGNMETYLQTQTCAKLARLRTETPAKLPRMKQRKNYLEGWHPFYLLPRVLRRKVIWCEDPTWQETTEVNLESLLNNTPIALRRKLKPHLCKDMLEKIPEFKYLSKELCNLAKPVAFPERSYIFRQGDPIHEAVFIVHGNLLSYGNSSQTGIQAKQLSAGCFFGVELLQRLSKHVAQQHQNPDEPPLDLPIASKTIQAATKVDAFALPAKDLIIAFATCNICAAAIQAAWRKFVKTKHLRETT